MPPLHDIWFLLIGVLLVGYAILDGFDLGAGILHLVVARDDDERSTVMNSIGPVWDGNEVWLLTAGGALFAAFPAVYATVFSGFYLALVLLLVALILRAVSLEFRCKEEGRGWRRAWDAAFAVGSLLPALLFGVAVGNVLRGVPLDAAGDYRGGLAGLLNPFSLLVGLLAVAMFVQQGAAWIVLRTEGAVQRRALSAGATAWLAFGVLFAAAAVFAWNESGHLWTNYRQPIAWLAPAVFVAAWVGVRWAFARRRDAVAFVLSSASIAAAVAVMGLALYPNLLPARRNLAASLTVHTASSSELTLGVMLVVALVGMPLVLFYTAFVYSRFLGKVSPQEHGY